MKENIKKGYQIQLLGFGYLSIRFITTGTAKAEKDATAKLIQSLVPSFSPSFYVINGKRIDGLIPNKITLVKYTGSIPADSVVDTTDPGAGSGSDTDNTEPDAGSGSGSDSGSDSGSGSSGSGSGGSTGGGSYYE